MTEEPTFNLAALAGQELLQARIRDLENELAQARGAGLDGTGPGRVTIHDFVIADVRTRAAQGEREYGGKHYPHNGLDGLQEAYEEALDMAFWLRQEIEERKGAAAGALLSLAAELDAEAERELAHRHDSMAARVIAPSTAVTYRAAARMALRRAGVDPDESEHASASHAKAEHVNAVPDGSQRVQSDGAP